MGITHNLHDEGTIEKNISNSKIQLKKQNKTNIYTSKIQLAMALATLNMFNIYKSCKHTPIFVWLHYPQDGLLTLLTTRRFFFLVEVFWFLCVCGGGRGFVFCLFVFFWLVAFFPQDQLRPTWFPANQKDVLPLTDQSEGNSTTSGTTRSPERKNTHDLVATACLLYVTPLLSSLPHSSFNESVCYTTDPICHCQPPNSQPNICQGCPPLRQAT